MSTMEYGWKKLLTLLGAAVFLGCCALVVIGQKSVGLSGLATMLGGLTGMVLCLWLYNRTHR